MAAPTVRTLDQILGELGTVYNPQIQSLQTRMSEIPGQVAAEEQGLQAKQTTAFGDILSGARRRGTGVAFGGIPLQEQAKYTASEFLPAVARLKQSGREQAMTLQDAINQVRERQQSSALSQRNYEQSRLDAYETEMRQLEAQRQAQAAANQTSDLSKYFDTMLAANTTPASTAAATSKVSQPKLDPKYESIANLVRAGNQNNIRSAIMALNKRLTGIVSNQEKKAIQNDIEIFKNLLGKKYSTYTKTATPGGPRLDYLSLTRGR